MNSVKDGGPAFPGYVIEESGDRVNLTKLHPGMTLRDYFAANAMQAMSNAVTAAIVEGRKINFQSETGGREEPGDYVAREAYAMADAMLAAREAGGGK